MKRTELQIISDISEVWCHLSPENLSCDGELPQYLVKQRYAALNKRLKALFKELGREVDEIQAYEYVQAHGGR